MELIREIQSNCFNIKIEHTLQFDIRLETSLLSLGERIVLGICEIQLRSLMMKLYLLVVLLVPLGESSQLKLRLFTM